MPPAQENSDMPLHHAVLALLSAEPAHGYALKGSFEQAVGEQWGGLNIGHLYQILDRLARDGLIESERQPQAVKPDRLVHQITPAGREELHRWLAEPSVRTRGYRDDFFLKVMAAAQAGDQATLAAVLRNQRLYLLTELRSLAAARAAAARSPLTDLLVKSAELHVRADLGIVDAAEHDLSPDALAALQVTAAPAAAPPAAASRTRRSHPA
jgi:DNA-binding PadR family transcriptional regulator